MDFETGHYYGTAGTRMYDPLNGRKTQPSNDMWISSLWGLRYNKGLKYEGLGNSRVLCPVWNLPGLKRNPNEKEKKRRIALLEKAGLIKTVKSIDGDSKRDFLLRGVTGANGTKCKLYCASKNG